ncbi:hypothetical protein GCM10009557_34720 [Virgisporangium ochraceum]|uniref:Uncharacterized protein n=1 Tax=Virgisporangium ochraceum TaxID=65505 RepID=A0A8J4EB34_9ACTN|nr:hypothetical protein [Virgisporangium ochraceum]GIJ68038.1 hypothetical protein Voc01_029550 [Virgisporangium ochraceum]
MTTSKADEITRLCEEWIKAASLPTGGSQISYQTEQFRLMSNGIYFHELTFDELRVAILGLTKTLLLPGMNTVVVNDHYFLWAWCAELLAGAGTNYFSHTEFELKQLSIVCNRSALSGAVSPDRRERYADLLQDWQMGALLRDSHLILAYLSFPLLEGVLKKECSTYVSPSGEIQKNFEIEQSDGSLRKYRTGKRCSSLRDLLVLLNNEIADNNLQSDLDSLRRHLSSLASSGEDGFDLLYRWRNSSMHGSTSFPTIGGTLLAIVSLICLHSMSGGYEAARERAVARASRQRSALASGLNAGTPWSFYPPYF